jgi:hypothetical protein
MPIDSARQLSFLPEKDLNSTPVVMNFTDTAGIGVDWQYEDGSLSSFNGTQCLDVTSEPSPFLLLSLFFFY